MVSYMHSEVARDGAERLQQKLDNGSLMMEILPNSYEQYNGDLELQNYASFCTFLKSRNGRKVLAMLEEGELNGYAN